MPRREKPVRHGRRLHGLVGEPEPIHHLHGAHRACGGVRGRGHETQRALGAREKACMTDRRDFIRALGAGALAPALQPLAPSLYRRPSLRKLDRIGLQLYTVRHQMEKDFEGTIARVAATGYREVEFAGYFGRSPRDVRALLDQHGLSAPSNSTSRKPVARSEEHTSELQSRL